MKVIKRIKQFFNSIQQLELIKLEYNSWNGFIITFLGIEYQGEKRGFIGDLFGIHFSRNHFIVYVLYLEFEIKKPLLTNKNDSHL